MLRAVLFIDTFDFDPAPCDESRSAVDEQSTVTPEFSTCWLDRSAIDRVEKKSFILFMTSHQHEEAFQLLGSLEFKAV